MYINASFHYVPEKVLDNSYFAGITGLSEAEILKKSGIQQRRVCTNKENGHTMALNALKSNEQLFPFSPESIDLIIGATYTPHDTLSTLAHFIQQQYRIAGAKALTISTACSSFVNAMELIKGYYAIGKTNHSLVLASECNSAFNDVTDIRSGHLWGDGAAAVFVSRDKIGEKSLMVLDIMTEGLGHAGMGPDAVYLRPLQDGLRMPDGRDVFINAIEIMSDYMRTIVSKNGFEMKDINYVVPHQANFRIINQIAKNLNYPNSQILMNINKFGNTGCASTPILLSENWNRFQFGDLIVLSVFGGGYSAGAMLLRVV